MVFHIHFYEQKQSFFNVFFSFFRVFYTKPLKMIKKVQNLISKQIFLSNQKTTSKSQQMKSLAMNGPR